MAIFQYGLPLLLHIADLRKVIFAWVDIRLCNGHCSSCLQEKGCALNLLLSEDKLSKWLHSLLKEQDIAMVGLVFLMQ